MLTWEITYTSGRTEHVTCTNRYQHNGLLTFERNGRIVLQIPLTSIEKLEPM